MNRTITRVRYCANVLVLMHFYSSSAEYSPQSDFPSTVFCSGGKFSVTLKSILLPIPNLNPPVIILPIPHPSTTPHSTVQGHFCHSLSQSRAMGIAPNHPPTIAPTIPPQTPASSKGSHAAETSCHAAGETPWA